MKGKSDLRGANHSPVLVNFCHLGTILRVVLAVEAALLALAWAGADSFGHGLRHFFELSALAQPALMLSLATLCLASPQIKARPYRQALAADALIGTVMPLLTAWGLGVLLPGVLDISPLRILAFSLAMSALLLGYFHLRGLALSPAIAEARLQALQARIRPHFLFNSLNAVLSLVRSEPRRAERALEDLAELFRALMGDNRDLAPLADEVQLTRAYLELEQLRLGDRLQIAWHIDKMPEDALIPPLILQPLVENAVYHGIEPRREAGEIAIHIYRSRDQVHLRVVNPYAQEGSHHRGNKLALQNIRERLALHFDLDATLKSEPVGAVYQVHISLPYTRAPRSRQSSAGR